MRMKARVGGSFIDVIGVQGPVGPQGPAGPPAHSMNVQTFESAAPPFSLGTFDGENIVGVQIWITGRAVVASGLANFYIRPNGLTSVQGGASYHRSDWNGSAGLNNVLGFNAQTVPGFYLGSLVWGTTEMLSGHGTLFTREGPGGSSSFDPIWLGQWTDRDDITNGNRSSVWNVSSYWDDGGPISSLAIDVNNATTPVFTGRIATQLISE